MIDISIGDKFGNFTVTGERIKIGKKYYVEVTCCCGGKYTKYCGELKSLKGCRKCFFDKRKIYSVGDKIGNFTVLEYRKSKGSNLKVKCCCGQEYYTNAFQIRETKECKICAKKRVGINHPSYKGTKYISKKELSSIYNNAKLRGLECNISIEFLDSLMQSQKHRCVYSGLLLSVGNSQEEKTASLDRIDSNFGYIEGNVQWVHKDINKLKTDFTEERFLFLVEMIAKTTLVRHQPE